MDVRPQTSGDLTPYFLHFPSGCKFTNSYQFIWVTCSLCDGTKCKYTTYLSYTEVWDFYGWDVAMHEWNDQCFFEVHSKASCDAVYWMGTGKESNVSVNGIMDTIWQESYRKMRPNFTKCDIAQRKVAVNYTVRMDVPFCILFLWGEGWVVNRKRDYLQSSLQNTTSLLHLLYASLGRFS